MLLVIPAIEIKNGRCAQQVQGVGDFEYASDPVSMAKLWRTENAKSLHVTDLDGVPGGILVNGAMIRLLIDAVDIPVEIGGSLGSFEAVREGFEIGAYRVVVGSQVIERPEEARRMIDAFGASKVVLGIDAVEGVLPASGMEAVTVAVNAKAIGFRRVLYTDVRFDGTMRGVNLKVLRELGEKTGMRITASGGITGLEELLKVQDLEKAGVDSVVIGRALYENKFSCQALWRRCEAGNYPYTARV
jgi:phosphoribosylformimino-5-aminoimidazole carboxamide ribotide isomerase